MTREERAERERRDLLDAYTEQLRSALRWRGKEYNRHRVTGRHLDGWRSEVRKARNAIKHIRALRLPVDAAEAAERQVSTMRIVDAVREALSGDRSPDDTTIQGKAARILRERDQLRTALDAARAERDKMQRQRDESRDLYEKMMVAIHDAAGCERNGAAGILSWIHGAKAARAAAIEECAKWVEERGWKDDLIPAHFRRSIARHLRALLEPGT